MRRLLLFVAVVGAAVYAATPPAARALPAIPAGLTEAPRGALHVHTRRSDGSGTVEQVARAAADAGLRFVILTDHGDASRTPELPTYTDGVLIVDAVEISTYDGHIVALGLKETPYPLGGEARDVLEDIRRLGGFAIAAHPGSPKEDLRWTDWTLPVDGLEYLNGDSEWRDESAWRLARVLLAYPARPVETLALLFDRSDEVLRRWDELTRQRRVVAVAGADAHARLGLPRAEEPYRGRLALPVPGYARMFRAMSIALPRARLTSNAADDAQAVLEEIRAGRVFSSIDALGSRPAFAFSASSGQFRAGGGEVLPIDGPVRLDVQVQGPPDVQIAIVRDGAQLLESSGPSLQQGVEPKPGVYRVEVRLPGTAGEPPVPWILSNPIYVGRSEREPTTLPASRDVQGRADLYTDGPALDWVVEHSSASQGAVDVVRAVDGTQLVFRYAISGAASSHPFAALVAPAGTTIAGHDRLTFLARADRPMRVSIQLRAPGSDPAGERWQRSVYVDETAREISVFFDDMKPTGVTSAAKPPLDAVRSILFVVDTVNTSAGTAGQLSVDAIRFER